MSKSMIPHAIILVFILNFLIACSSSPDIQETEAIKPVLLQLFDGQVMQDITADDALYEPISLALNELIANVDSRVRTFYTQERFDEELASLPRIEASYSEAMTLLEGEESPTDFVVVVPDGQPLLLARQAGETTWNAYASSDSAAFDALIERLTN